MKEKEYINEVLPAGEPCVPPEPKTAEVSQVTNEVREEVERTAVDYTAKTREIEMWGKAAEKWEKNGNFLLAAEAYERLGNTAKAREIKMWGKAAEKYEMEGDFLSAARAYEGSGNTAKAQEMSGRAAEEREREGNFLSAAKAYENLAKDPPEN